jgi:hypothetical protein
MLNQSPKSLTTTTMMYDRMMSPRGSGLKIGMTVALAVVLFTPTTKVLGQGFNVSEGGSSVNVGSAVGGTDSAQAKSIVQAYMHQALPPPHFVSFLEWKDYSATGPNSSITLKYQDQSAYGRPVVATVRFQIEGGKVTKTEVVQNAPTASSTPSPATSRSTPSKNRFADALNTAKYSAPRLMRKSDAYSLADLEKAKAQAQAEKKPLGFVMVWDVMFKTASNTRTEYGDSALHHFYQAFHQNVVLVFVRHETELRDVPEAVKKGFFGPDEGGHAPNMAVTDATASEFIVEIPYLGKNGPGRDPLFASGAEKINAWLDTHPDAVATPKP